MIDIKEVERIALDEIKAEKLRQQVDKIKEKVRQPWYKKIIRCLPKITITWRK